jgi:hypothetical protein
MAPGPWETEKILAPGACVPYGAWSTTLHERVAGSRSARVRAHALRSGPRGEARPRLRARAGKPAGLVGRD